jgi:aminodeoxyfutalosine synthase
LGLKLAQVALSYGADDIHGTIIEEHIFRMAGGGQGQLQTEAELVKAIREAGREPVQRDTFYNALRRPGENLGRINKIGEVGAGEVAGI